MGGRGAWGSGLVLVTLAAGVVAWQNRRLEELVDVLVKKLIHNPSQPVGVLLVGHEKGEGEVSSLSSSSLTQQRMVSLTYVCFQTDGSTGSFESKELI